MPRSFTLLALALLPLSCADAHPHAILREATHLPSPPAPAPARAPAPVPASPPLPRSARLKNPALASPMPGGFLGGWGGDTGLPLDAWMRTFAAHENMKSVFFWGPSLWRRPDADALVLHLPLSDHGDDPWIARLLGAVPAEVCEGWRLELGSDSASAQHIAVPRELARQFPALRQGPLVPRAGDPPDPALDDEG